MVEAEGVSLASGNGPLPPCPNEGYLGRIILEDEMGTLVGIFVLEVAEGGMIGASTIGLMVG